MSNVALSSQYQLRPAEIGDLDAIHSLLKGYSDQGNLLPRSLRDLETNLVDFQVVDSGSEIVACGALELFPNQLGEVRSLAVAPEYSQIRARRCHRSPCDHRGSISWTIQVDGSDLRTGVFP